VAGGIEKYTLASMSPCVYTYVYALGPVKGLGVGRKQRGIPVPFWRVSLAALQARDPREDG
jgi:hypothetical protein